MIFHFAVVYTAVLAIILVAFFVGVQSGQSGVIRLGAWAEAKESRARLRLKKAQERVDRLAEDATIKMSKLEL
jgi:hypothetical protein